jgi:hypothetical protein
LCSFQFIDASTPDDRQPAFVLGGVTFAAFLGMMTWSVVLCVRSILRHENSVWSVGVLYAMFVEGIVAILIHYS